MSNRRRAQVAQRRISADEREYLREVEALAREGQDLDRQAGELEQRALGLRRAALARYGAHESYLGHLTRKYGLKEGVDMLDPESGLISRVPVLDLGEVLAAPRDLRPVNGVGGASEDGPPGDEE